MIDETKSGLAGAVIPVVSDLHVGSWFGLCAEKVILDAGSEYRRNKLQDHLWECWEDFWGEVWATSEARNLPVVPVINGDLTEGIKGEEIIALSDEGQVDIALSIFAPIRSRSRDFFVVRGTPRHIGGLGGNEESFAKQIGAHINQIADASRTFSFYHLRIKVAGVRFDFAHHVGVNSVPWTRGNAIRSEVLKTTFECLSVGLAPPDILHRGHTHKFSDTGESFPVRGICSPGWQYTTEFIHKVARLVAPEIGGIIYVVQDGRFEVHLKRYGGEPVPEVSL